MKRLARAANALVAATTLTLAPVGAKDFDPAAVVASACLPLELEKGRIGASGAEFLVDRAASSQFVLLGESHFDLLTPLFADELYRRIAPAGFATFVVENDPLAMEAIETQEYCGDVFKIATLAKRYPTHIGFASDQDLELYAAVCARGRLWGIEQAQGATRYLEELVETAPSEPARSAARALLDLAREQETRERASAYLHDAPERTGQLVALRESFAAEPGSRADRLLESLVRSAEIYAYHRRGKAGEPLGLYNNTEREALFKQQFLQYYRAAAGDRPLKAMFKMGSWHMYRGKSPGQAYTIGNFAHEFAIANGMRAFGIMVLPLGPGYLSYADYPDWLKKVLPPAEPRTPIVIDLDKLKPHASRLARLAADAERWQVRDLVHGFDAIVILPGGRPATWERTGFPSPARRP